MSVLVSPVAGTTAAPYVPTASAYAARFNRILNAQERLDIYEGLKAFYAGKIEIE